MLVFISVTSVILYRVYMTISFCDEKDTTCGLLHGTVLATLLNTSSIMILGRDFETETGILGLDKKYKDNCGSKKMDNCMSLLSFQLLVLMIVKPFPKFMMDVLIPLIKKASVTAKLTKLMISQLMKEFRSKVILYGNVKT
ncbi:anoctamin [Caerostris extrusa]|uniref:Anoctamin n=1 Tax=Caerostris extrusa TaxID=172846 RepID=A0AAV4RCP7_CAEEX|nr:anoctamin [Caerostris extrusa]